MAHASGYLAYNDITENLVIHGRPTWRGLALLDAPNEDGSTPFKINS